MTGLIIALTIGAVVAVVALMVRARRQRRAIRLTVIALALIMILLGVVAGSFQAQELAQLRARRSWPEARGVVIDAHIAGEKAIVPVVKYTYTVADSTCSGASDLGTPGFGNAAKRLDAARALIADYPPGKSIVVHYNPVQPSESYLTTAVPWNAYMRYGLWIFALLAGPVVLGFFGFKRSATIQSQ